MSKTKNEQIENQFILTESEISKLQELTEQKLDEAGFGKPLISIKKLYEIGAHICNTKKRVNPKFTFFYTTNAGKKVIDLVTLSVQLKRCYINIINAIKNSSNILFVNTSNEDVKKMLMKDAEIVNKTDENGKKMMYSCVRWLGGTLTNLSTIYSSIRKLYKLDTTIADKSTFHDFSKKEQSSIIKERDKLERFFGGIKYLKSFERQDLVIVVSNVLENFNAVNESNLIKKARVIGMCSCNVNPYILDTFIPVNVYSYQVQYLINALLVDAVFEAKDLPVKFAFKDDKDIVLPLEKKSEEKKDEVNKHKKFSR